ncbi:hypothetical protein [Microbispora bryophytorum]|uniref:hypothetical protein n=1 Tax=Microbispora bryophytorum TaxID=1460882 RepID=UPI0033D5F8FE
MTGCGLVFGSLLGVVFAAPAGSLPHVFATDATVPASLRFGWGLLGIWSGLSAFLLIRMVTVPARLRSGRWAVLGAVR